MQTLPKFECGVQTGKNNRPFELIQMSKSSDAKWINRVEKYCWNYLFVYLDNRKEGFKVTIGYNDEFLKLEKII
jgi:hypothetical protein